ncbi:NAD(P)-binding protein [Coccomyxa subellipsoidea C-169]|uniref:NAD(P)-binding protein n=1 Tax=Coccomyxa subellipsoidea (strain C-169) TaxID=574566 RepID=I0YY45_COCSC|nr:NAD(P)-binding protein [Coccomyxa subellipsoidea C-169]EIE23314.1 NAD(P)-binding protein [Coccomyxa subellipsoidea C-169]|eukprot:XP_005647858.1 NAD(P)-binding protein [Coccomyxa subellipsoidea C-169]
MKIFVTGPSGYVGAEVARLLLSDGHFVVGLARSEARAEGLRNAGIEPVIGELSDLDVLAKASASADAVIHTAFFHTGDYAEATRLDIAAVGAMTDAMAGSNKPFIMSSATGVLGETGPVPVSEEFPLDPHHCIKPPGSRVICERAALLAAGKGVRIMVFRLPPYVWGNGGSFFIPLHLSAAREHSKAYYILPGTQKTCGVHVEDLAKLYLLGIQKEAGIGIYHTTTGNDYTAKQIAEAVGANAGVPTEGISAESAIEQGIWPAWAVPVFAMNNCASSAKAERQLAWGDYRSTDMLQDIASGSYAQKS